MDEHLVAVVGVVAGEADELSRHKVARWRQASGENARTLRELERLWALVGEVEPRAVPRAPEAATILAEARARRRRAQGRAARRALVRGPWVRYGLAVAVVAALVLGVVWTRGRPAAGSPGLTSVASSTGTGEVVTMTLSDGSVVRVAPASRVEFPPTRGPREVVLDGKAFFAVAHAETPFVVRTRAGTLTVTGTRFEARTDGDATRVVTVEGTVRLTSPAGDADVHAGQVGFLNPDGPPRVVARDDVWSLLDWAGGLLVFQATPLGEVGSEIERHFGRPVRVADRVAQRRVTAWFEDESLDEVLSSVCVVADVACRVGADTVVVGR